MQAVPMGRQEFKVEVHWDPEASVWYVSDSDVPGLATGADTIEELLRKLEVLIPELLELNGSAGSPTDNVPFALIARGSAPSRRAANG